MLMRGPGALRSKLLYTLLSFRLIITNHICYHLLKASKYSFKSIFRMLFFLLS